MESDHYSPTEGRPALVCLLFKPRKRINIILCGGQCKEDQIEEEEEEDHQLVRDSNTLHLLALPVISRLVYFPLF